MNYKDYWEQLHDTREELNSLLHSYWNDYSNIGTWQFWTVLASLVIPLIILFFTVDRRRIFELFFFGYTIHILWSYTSIVIENYGYFVHTYFLAPIFPFGLTMNASALPVSFLLLYQYCTNTNKNFYLYALIVIAIFSFGVTSIEESLGLLEFRKGMNQFYIFIIDIVIVFSSYWFTKLILKMKARWYMLTK